jgi:ABC-type iron transport system FetAB permease component
LLLSTFDVDWVAWLRRIVLPNVPGAAVQLTVGFVTLHWVSRLDQLWELLLVCAASCIVNGLVFGAVGLDREERRHLTTRAWLG